VEDTSKPLGLSRRNLLTGLVVTPVLAATVEPSAAQTDGPRWTPQQAQAALKDAKGTKLVLLGTAAGPVPGRSTPAIDSIDDDTWRAPVAKYFKGEIIVGKDLMVV
jgi:hypothetical protein